MNKITKLTLIIIVFALIGYVASFFIQSPTNGTEDISTFQFSLANSVLYTSLYIGAAILFLVGVSAYKAKLRVAYMGIAVGIALTGIGLAHVVLLRIFGLLESPWVEYGGVMLPFILAGLAIYLGTRMVAKLVNINSPLTKFIFVVPSVAVCVGLTSLLPHGSSSLPEIFFDVSNAISAVDIVLYSFSLGLAVQIKKRGGAHYATSMKWLMLGFIGNIIVSLSILLSSLITGEALTGYILDAIVIIIGCTYLKAGHSFARTKEL